MDEELKSGFFKSTIFSRPRLYF